MKQTVLRTHPSDRGGVDNGLAGAAIKLVEAPVLGVDRVRDGEEGGDSDDVCRKHFGWLGASCGVVYGHEPVLRNTVCLDW